MRRGYRIGDRVLRPAMVGVVDRADDGDHRSTTAEAAGSPSPIDRDAERDAGEEAQ